jgi:hypothetical protein
MLARSVLAKSGTAGQATFSPDEDLDEDDLAAALTVSAGFLAAGLSADPLPLPLPLPDSVEVEVEVEVEPESADCFSLAASEAVALFLLSVR